MKYHLYNPSNPKRRKTSRVNVFEGFGTPEGSVTGFRGDFYHNLNGGTGTTVYYKASGHNTNTGWVAVGAGTVNWTEEIFVATQGQTEFTLTLFTIDSGDKIEVWANGMLVDEGASYDYTIDYANEKIIFNAGQGLNRRIKIRKYI